MDMADYRARMDALDRQLAELFTRRMALAAEIAAYKKEKGLPVLDEKREREKLLAVTEASPAELRDYTPRLFALLMELSRSYQERLMGGEAG